MFSKVVLFGLLAIVVVVVAEEVPILSQTSDIEPDGSFSWSYESADGSQQQESGSADAVQGSASWTDPEGGQHELKYVAGEDGYQPQGADLPVGPETPAAILRALDWIAAQPTTAVL